MKRNNHNTHFYSIQEVERCLKSTEEFEDGEQLFYFIGALRYVYDDNKKKDKEIERLNNIINTFEDDLERELNISVQESLFGPDKYTVIHSTLEKMLKYFRELKESGNNE